MFNVNTQKKIYKKPDNPNQINEFYALPLLNEYSFKKELYFPKVYYGQIFIVI